MEQMTFEDLLPKQQRKKHIETLKLFELFAGYGSQSLALKRYNIPYESVGYCEIDKYAIQAYKALHGEHIKNYGDITKVDVVEIPNMNLLTYSFPCQDISVAGKQRGLSKNSGTRSSLLWECYRIIEAKIPEYLMMENVKNLVGKQNVPDFQAWLDTLTLLGYNNYWKIVNAKHCGVPQNRERVFCVSIRQDVDDGLFKFEEPFDNGLRLKDLLEGEVDEKYYISEEKCGGLIKQIQERQEFSYCIDANYWKGTSPEQTIKKSRRQLVAVKEATKQGYAIASDGDSINLEHPNSKTRRGRVGVGVAQTLTTSCNQAVVEMDKQAIENISDQYSFAKKKYKEYFDVHGYLPNMFNPYNNAEIKDFAPTVTTNCDRSSNSSAVLIKTKYRIRKLTPRECGRLMGLTDQEIDKIQSVEISNSQQYKMFGNSIVVDAMEFLKNLQG